MNNQDQDLDAIENTEVQGHDDEQKADSPFAGVGKVDPLVFVQTDDTPEAREAASRIPRQKQQFVVRESTPFPSQPAKSQAKPKRAPWRPGATSDIYEKEPAASSQDRDDQELPKSLRWTLSIIAIVAPLTLVAYAIWFGFSLAK